LIAVVQKSNGGTGAKLADALASVDDKLVGVVNWTGGVLASPDTPPVLMLNSRARTDKLFQLRKLKEAGLPVPPFLARGEEGALDPSWVPRTKFHQQGFDFTRPIRPDFWVKRLSLDDEWRLHIFKTKRGNFKLLRSGLKLPKGPRFHPWVKSHRLGWKISYIGGAPQDLVSLGRKALEVLALDFGAVDIARSVGGKPYLLEVNTCPGLEAGTLSRYAEAIQERLG
jgi:hypothetical protein